MICFGRLGLGFETEASSHPSIIVASPYSSIGFRGCDCSIPGFHSNQSGFFL